MELMLGILQGLAIIIGLPALVGFAIAGSLLLSDRRASAKRGVAQLVCRVNVDCPDGYICKNGVCVLANR